MLDNPEKTARLLAALKAAVPFKVELVPSLVTYLRAQHVAIADQTQHIVSNLSYAGDEGGIGDGGSRASIRHVNQVDACTLPELALA
jgi:hypothetical protein